MPSSEVVSLKVTGKGVSVHRIAQNGSHKEGLTLDDCPDVAHSSLYEALDAVRLAIIRRCKIKGATFASSFALQGISVSKASNGHRQFTPSGTLDYGWGEKGVSLPALHEMQDNETGPAILSDVELKQMDALLAEAGKYADQDREQKEMDLGDGADSSGGSEEATAVAGG